MIPPQGYNSCGALGCSSSTRNLRGSTLTSEGYGDSDSTHCRPGDRGFLLTDPGWNGGDEPGEAASCIQLLSSMLQNMENWERNREKLYT
jgi:hypothetical protein